MKIAARRRLAIGVLGTSTALIAGVLIVPASAEAGGLTITPTAVFNTQTETLTFESTEADFFYGGEAVFTRLGTSGTFTVPIDGGADSPPPDHEGSADVDFTDMGD